MHGRRRQAGPLGVVNFFLLSDVGTLTVGCLVGSRGSTGMMIFCAVDCRLSGRVNLLPTLYCRVGLRGLLQLSDYIRARASRGGWLLGPRPVPRLGTNGKSFLTLITD